MGLFSKKRKSYAKTSTLNPQRKTGFFGAKNPKKKTTGTVNIAKNSSPYLSKNTFSKAKLKKRNKISSRFKNKSSAIQPPSKLNPNKSNIWKKILISLLASFITIATGYFIFLTDFFLINEYHIYEDDIEITTNLKLNEIVRKNLVEQNIFLYQGEDLKTQILELSPEYQTIHLEKSLPKTINIKLEKFPQSANILNEVTTSDGVKILKKFIINTNGLIVKENEENPELVYIKIESDIAFQLNTRPIEQKNLDNIIKLVNLFEEKIGIDVIEAIYLKKAREIHLRTTKEFTVWVDLTKDILPQIDKLKMALPKLDIYNTPLHYIDLRISGVDAEKIIFKRK